jgi:hypothetical protein
MSPWYSLDRRLGGPQSRSERGGKGIHFHALSHYSIIDNYIDVYCRYESITDGGYLKKKYKTSQSYNYRAKVHILSPAF